MDTGWELQALNTPPKTVLCLTTTVVTQVGDNHKARSAGMLNYITKGPLCAVLLHGGSGRSMGQVTIHQRNTVSFFFQNKNPIPEQGPTHLVFCAPRRAREKPLAWLGNCRICRDTNPFQKNQKSWALLLHIKSWTLAWYFYHLLPKP